MNGKEGEREKDRKKREGIERERREKKEMIEKVVFENSGSGSKDGETRIERTTKRG